MDKMIYFKVVIIFILSVLLAACSLEGDIQALRQKPVKNPGSSISAPSAPVISTSDSMLTVIWQAVEGATVYEVWAGTVNDPNKATKRGGDVSRLSAVITGLTNGTTYYVWVKAKNSVGTSGFSPVASGIPSVLATAPQAPSIPTVSIGNGEISISWAAVAGATAYEIWLATTNNSASALKYGADISDSLSATIGGLNNGTAYYIWMKAKNSAGTSGFSPVANGIPSVLATAPQAPSVPTVSIGDRQISISWAAVAGATAYEIWLATTNNSASALKYGADISDSFSATIDGLNNGTAYYIWMKAKNSVGTSGFSPVASGIPSVLATAPQAPSVPTVSIGNGEISISWAAVAGATAYEIWLATTNNSALALKHGADIIDSLSATIGGLNNGTAYYIWMKAKNSAGTSGFSLPANGIPSVLVTAPQAPSVPSVSIGNGQISISWAAVAGATAYEIWLATTNNSASALKYGADISDSLSATIDGLNNGTAYYIWLKAKNNVGTSGFSPVASGIPIAGAGTPSLTAENARISASWAAIAGTDQYEVFCGTEENPPQTPVQTINAPSTSAAITDLVNGTSYNVWIRGKNPTGTGAMSNPASAKPIGNMGTVTINTGDGQLSLSWSAVAGADEYEVYYSTANTVPSNSAQTVSTTTVTINGLTNGTMYYVWVKPKNDNGSGNASTVTSGKPLGTPDVPIVSSDYKQLFVSWPAVTGADEYEVYYGTSTPTTLATTTSETSATITGLTSGMTYYVRLRTKNSTGVSDYGPSASGVPDNERNPGLYLGDDKIGNQNLSAALSYISTNAQTGDDFYIVLGTHEFAAPMTLNYSDKTVGVTLLGYGGERTITLNANGSLFTINSGVTFTLDENITLVGLSTNNASLVRVNSGGTFTMNSGTICGNTTNISDGSNYGGGIYVVGGTFIMNGGTISRNKTVSNSNGSYGSRGGGIYVASGTFTMNGGTISGNTVSGTWDDGGGVFLYSGTFSMDGGTISGNTANNGGGIAVNSGVTVTINGGEISGNTASSGGGGVFLYGGIVTMHGGIISGNTASNYGGGIFVYPSATFKKLPNGNGQNSGVIYGSEETGVDAGGAPLRNTASSNGSHAVYASSGIRNATAGQTDHIDSTTDKGLSANGNPPYGE